ncbi:MULTISPECIES: tRNA sulfurtransferase [unclassified Haladaptatus]|uniref:tRNA sulfurtransferase n=1 Tax=unclassified Haladaptatus TaxID=2622732 RepID=UPI0023E8EE0D|nr:MULTISPECIES: tRNA sulfurtransferase [unclassified Haladaptatus]
MNPPGADTVLVRYGDMGVKSPQVLGRMEQMLRDNIRALLSDRAIEGTVRKQHSRLFIDTTEEAIDAATDAACDAFGVVSASPVTVTDPTMDAMKSAVVEAAREVYTEGAFAVSARRAGEKSAHPFSSEDIEREVGTAVWEATEERFEPEVDLEQPDCELFVECRADHAYVYVEKRAGPGGLPLGTQDPVVALISGGIDSPVAAWELMKRGCPIIPVYFDFEEFGGVDHQARVVESVETLARYAPNFDMELRMVPAGKVARLLVDELQNTRMLSLRRFMFMVAEHVAREEHAVGIVTGEAIGQKSSQTGANLMTTTAATSLPVYRPLVTMDKPDIVERARALGTFTTANIEAGCNRIAPNRPETRASIGQVEAAEPDELSELAVEAAKKARRIALQTA